MKIPMLALAALAALAWAAVPAFAEEKPRKEVRVEKKIVRDAPDAEDDDREGPPPRREGPGADADGDHEREREGAPREGGPREGGHMRHGPMERGGWGHDGEAPDPAMKARFEKFQALQKALHEKQEKLHRGTDAEKAAAKTETRKLLAELFDAKLAMQEDLVKKMESHLAEQKASVERKKASRDKLIDAKLERMAGDDDW